MALEIAEKDGVVELKGKVNAHNIGAILIFLQEKLLVEQNLKVDLSKVQQLDIKAALLLEELYRASNLIIKRTQFYGKDNACVMETLRFTKTAYILSESKS